MSPAGALDFTSSCYLGMRHPARTLAEWDCLTTGVPAALAEPSSARAAAAGLARLVNTERAVLATSTLHAFFDLFVTLGARDLLCCVDTGTYPIAVWGVERAACRGARVRWFPHQDVAALRQVLRDHAGTGRRPVVVTDGLCPGCGRVAPVREYLRALRPSGGLLVVDDTQAIGVLGDKAAMFPPYGRGGGGTLRATGVTAPDVLVVGSLAKAFGVPAAFVGGPASLVARYGQCAETRTHCSPPSLAHVAAARQALDINAARGDELRARVAGLIARLRGGARELGYRTGPAWFPVQTVEPPGGVPPADLYRRLLESGVRGVLHRPACRPAPACGFVITAEHTHEQIDRLVAALAEADADLNRRRARSGGSLGRGQAARRTAQL